MGSVLHHQLHQFSFVSIDIFVRQYLSLFRRFSSNLSAIFPFTKKIKRELFSRVQYCYEDLKIYFMLGYKLSLQLETYSSNVKFSCNN